jgi:ABC-type multidrug transport system ATPase subunit
MTLKPYNETTTVIKLVNVSKRFKFLLAANKINLEIKKNEIIGFIGSNGAGKSTILNLIAGVIKPTKGTVSINNKNILQHKNELKRKIILFSYYSFLYDDLTGLENLEFWLKLYSIEKHKEKNLSLKDYILETADTFGIKNWLSRPVQELSTGMRKKIDFLRAILIEPDFLLLDEPFSGLDPKNIDFFIKTIQKYRENGTICIVSHNIDIIANLCDRVFIIRKGKIADQVSLNNNPSKDMLENLLSYFNVNA